MASSVCDHKSCSTCIHFRRATNYGHSVTFCEVNNAVANPDDYAADCEHFLCYWQGTCTACLLPETA